MMPPSVAKQPAAPALRGARVRLGVVGAASLVLITGTDGAALRLARSAAPALLWLPLARVPSFVVCLALYAALVRSGPLAPPAVGTPWRRVGAVTAGLLVTAGLAPLAGTYVPALPGAALVGFLVFGLAAEELLFRGVVFALVRRALPERARTGVWLSAVLFALSHLGYHAWHTTPAALEQVGYTFALGVALGALRLWAASLLPGTVAHLGVNAAALLGAFVVGRR